MLVATFWFRKQKQINSRVRVDFFGLALYGQLRRVMPEMKW